MIALLAALPLTLVVYGDTRTDHRAHAAVIKEIIAAAPDLVVHTGDLVKTGTAEEWAAWDRVAAPLLKTTEVLPVAGNHDLLGDQGVGLRARFKVLEKKAYYAVTRGPVRLIAIDAEGSGPGPEQIAWLEDTLKAAEADPTIHHSIAFVHRGPFSGHPERTGHPGMKALLPKLQSWGLDLIVSGHDHFYERGISGTGLPYIIAGGGGAPLYPTRGAGKREDHTAEFSRSVHSFVRLRVTGKFLRGCAVDLGGAAMDCFTLP